MSSSYTLKAENKHRKKEQKNQHGDWKKKTRLLGVGDTYIEAIKGTTCNSLGKLYLIFIHVQKIYEQVSAIDNEEKNAL